MTELDLIFQQQTILLQPGGRAFKLPAPELFIAQLVTQGNIQIVTEDGLSLILENEISGGGILRRVYKALDVIKAQFYTDVVSTFDSINPDSNAFTADDAAMWESNLGITTGNTDLATRKLAVKRKMNYPGTVAPRQNVVKVQDQLRAAGFDVYVYENYWPDGSGGYYSKTPAEVLGVPVGDAYYGAFDYGQVDYGASYALEGVEIVANHIEAELDANFVFNGYESTFFIAGVTITDFAAVSEERKAEFKQLILTLKPQETVVFTFINYE